MSGKKSILVFRDRPIYSNGLICLIHNVYCKIFFIIVGAIASSYPSYNIRKDLVIFFIFLFYVWKETSCDSLILQRLRTENRLLRQRVDLLEQESSNLADRLIQGQVTRAEVEEHTFAIKRELAAIRQHDIETSHELENARQRIRKLSEIVENPLEKEEEDDDDDNVTSKAKAEEMSLKSEMLRQKEEMINCLQDELIKVRLREAENEERIRNLGEKVSELEEVSSEYVAVLCIVLYYMYIKVEFNKKEKSYSSLT